MKAFLKKWGFSILVVLALSLSAHFGFAQEVAEEAGDSTKLPWFFNLLWPVISTAIVSVLRIISGQLKDKVPPVFWPVLNTVIAAILAAIQSTSDPAQLIKNIVEAVLAALGLNKAVDIGKGKTSTISPADNKAAKDAGIIQ